jgi:hypothetical protein
MLFRYLHKENHKKLMEEFNALQVFKQGEPQEDLGGAQCASDTYSTHLEEAQRGSQFFTLEEGANSWQLKIQMSMSRTHTTRQLLSWPRLRTWRLN